MDITMPQLGETVTEGTITRWIKQIGEAVALDEPLFEVSTDKVDSEVPSPAAGTLTEILVAEGETATVGARLAVLGAPGSVPTTPVPSAPAPSAPAPSAPAPATEPRPAPAPAPAPAAPAAPSVVAPAPGPTGNGAGTTVTSPVVRRLIAEHGLDPDTITGTGDGGRVTRNDVLDAVARQRSAGGTQPITARVATPTVPSVAPVATPPAPTSGTPRAEAVGSRGNEVIPFNSIRRLTAEHMVRSKATSAHVYTSVEVDFERVERVRAAHRDEWKNEEGFSLTYLPFILRATCDAIAEFPRVNASIEEQSLVVHHGVDIGIAVDLDFQGLIAPVLRDADGKRLRHLSRDVFDLATRARTKKLLPDEVFGGTFTITNPGPFGSYMTLPIINQPQVAILSTDGIAKRPVVVEGPDGEDTIAIHHTGILAIAWDHRAFDGAYASAFLRAIKTIIESRDWEAEFG